MYAHQYAQAVKGLHFLAANLFVMNSWRGSVAVAGVTSPSENHTSKLLPAGHTCRVKIDPLSFSLTYNSVIRPIINYATTPPQSGPLSHPTGISKISKLAKTPPFDFESPPDVLRTPKLTYSTI